MDPNSFEAFQAACDRVRIMEHPDVCPYCAQPIEVGDYYYALPDDIHCEDCMDVNLVQRTI